MDSQQHKIAIDIAPDFALASKGSSIVINPAMDILAQSADRGVKPAPIATNTITRVRAVRGFFGCPEAVCLVYRPAGEKLVGQKLIGQVLAAHTSRVRVAFACREVTIAKFERGNRGTSRARRGNNNLERHWLLREREIPIERKREVARGRRRRAGGINLSHHGHVAGSFRLGLGKCRRKRKNGSKKD